MWFSLDWNGRNINSSFKRQVQEIHWNKARSIYSIFTIIMLTLIVIKGSILGVKPSIPVLRGAEVVWWWLLLRKRHSWALSLTISSAVSSSSNLCLVSLNLNSLASRTPVLLSLLLDLDKYGGVDPLDVFLLFLKMVAVASGVFRSVRFRSVGGPLM